MHSVDRTRRAPCMAFVRFVWMLDAGTQHQLNTQLRAQMTSNKRKIELKPNVMRDESVIYVMK